MSLEDVDEITLERMREDLWIPMNDPRMDVTVAVDCLEEAMKHLHVFGTMDQAKIKAAYHILKEVVREH